MKPRSSERASADRKSKRLRSAESDEYSRKYPIGAEVVPGGVHFRVWASAAKRVELRISADLDFWKAKTIKLRPEKGGYHAAFIKVPLIHGRPAERGWIGRSATNPTSGASRGRERGRADGSEVFYRYKLDSGEFPDPASRFQPQGPHGPSQIVDPQSFKWTDKDWQGPAQSGLVIYEMHIGTYTAEGTYAAAARHLTKLKDLGVNLLEIMPVAEFPGRFGWGYDGVNLFAPSRLYGSPDDLRAFVNEAHRLGIGVILDVVYNHLGPDGNYLKKFSKHYFTDRHKNEWGEAINFDGQDSGPVREFFISNAAYWIDEFHFDGLRLDATQQIFDGSKKYILAEITEAVKKAAGKRRAYVVGENETQHARLAQPIEQGGYGLDALWNDDFHHAARVALTGRREAYYSDYKGSPQELISTAKRGFLYQGQWYAWQKKRRGKPVKQMKPHRFVHFLENHDQVANSLRGAHLWHLTSPGRFKAMTALLLLGPQTPMLFQGQEFAASSPFVYFADHHPELAKLVAKGRKEFLGQFKTIACPEAEPHLTDPSDEKTFLASKVSHEDRDKHRMIYELHRDLLRIRREDRTISNAQRAGVDGAVLGSEAFVIRFFGKEDDDRLLLVNLGRDLSLSPAPEPLLAPPEDCDWTVKWCSEAACYGGCGNAPMETNEKWELAAERAVLLKPMDINE